MPPASTGTQNRPPEADVRPPVTQPGPSWASVVKRSEAAEDAPDAASQTPSLPEDTLDEEIRRVVLKVQTEWDPSYLLGRGTPRQDAATKAASAAATEAVKQRRLKPYTGDDLLLAAAHAYSDKREQVIRSRSRPTPAAGKSGALQGTQTYQAPEGPCTLLRIKGLQKPGGEYKYRWIKQALRDTAGLGKFTKLHVKWNRDHSLSVIASAEATEKLLTTDGKNIAIPELKLETTVEIVTQKRKYKAQREGQKKPTAATPATQTGNAKITSTKVENKKSSKATESSEGAGNTKCNDEPGPTSKAQTTEAAPPTVGDNADKSDQDNGRLEGPTEPETPAAADNKVVTGSEDPTTATAGKGSTTSSAGSDSTKATDLVTKADQATEKGVSDISTDTADSTGNVLEPTATRATANIDGTWKPVVVITKDEDVTRVVHGAGTIAAIPTSQLKLGAEPDRTSQ